MFFAYNEDQALLRDTTRRFLENKYSLTATRAELEHPRTVDRSLWREGAALGWTALLVPEEHDGGSITDQPIVDLAALAEELGRGLFPGPVLATNVVADALVRSGTDTQRLQHLPAIAAGETVAVWGLSGDGTPGSAGASVTVAQRGDELVLDGVTRFVHGADGADLLMLNVSTDLGPSVVLVPLPSPRVTLRPLGTIDLTRTFFEIALDGVVVPATNLLGTQGGGAELIGRALQLATIIASAEAVGAAEYLLDLVVAYTKTRVQFGRTLGSFQAVKHHLANQVVALEGARAAARYSALALNDQRPDAVEAVHVAGSYVRDACSAIASQSLQLLGGIGFSWEHDLHLFLRRAKTDQALYGEPSWHRDQLFTLLEKAAAR